MSHSFYGWENAGITDSNGLTPCDYYDLLSGIWCADTCAPRMRAEWTPENKTLGQCSVTAFLMQDVYGGKVCGVPLGDGNYHCFNVVGECVFDLTSEQFGAQKLDYDHCPEQERSVHFAKAEKKERYERLKAALRKAACIHPMTMAHLARYGEIYAEAFSAPPWNDPWEPANAEIHVRELMESRQSYGLEYTVDGRVVGFLLGSSMLFHYGRTFEVNDLAVASAYQGRGIGKALLKRCIADMKARGIVGLHLITGADSYLPAFYARQGFHRETQVILMGMELQ